jgi:hypothetical protein
MELHEQTVCGTDGWGTKKGLACMIVTLELPLLIFSNPDKSFRDC